MKIECLGGPYDGRAIQAIELERHVLVMVLEAKGQARRFVYLPDPADWGAVLGGRKRVDDSDNVHYYELIRTSHGIKLIYDIDRAYFWETMTEALREIQNGNGQAPGTPKRLN